MPFNAPSFHWWRQLKTHEHALKAFDCGGCGLDFGLELGLGLGWGSHDHG